MAPDLDADDVTDLRRRQAEGEIDPEIDPAFLLIVLQAAVSVGVLFPRDVRRYLDMDPSSDEFFAHADRAAAHPRAAPGHPARRGRQPVRAVRHRRRAGRRAVTRSGSPSPAR